MKRETCQCLLDVQLVRGNGLLLLEKFSVPSGWSRIFTEYPDVVTELSALHFSACSPAF